jgi:hypothetical protein
MVRLTFCRLCHLTLKFSYLHLQQCESRLSRCLHLRGAEGGQKAQVSAYIGPISKLEIPSISYPLVYASIRLPETQPESTNTPDLGQINGSNSANSPDSNDFIGLDALLEVLQSANASNVVSPPQPDNFDFSRSYAHGSEAAAQVAAAAINQVSQEEAPDIHYPGPFDGMILAVRLLSVLQYIVHLIIRLFFDSSAALVPQYQLPISNATFPTRRSQLSCSPTSLIDLRFTGYFLSSIGHFLRVAIAHVHRVNYRLLSSLLPCWPSLARLRCSFSQ